MKTNWSKQSLIDYWKLPELLDGKIVKMCHEVWLKNFNNFWIELIFEKEECIVTVNISKRQKLIFSNKCMIEKNAKTAIIH